MTREEAIATLAWARQVDGWPDHGPTPIWVYPTAPREVAAGGDRR